MKSGSDDEVGALLEGKEGARAEEERQQGRGVQELGCSLLGHSCCFRGAIAGDSGANTVLDLWVIPGAA